MNIYQLSSYLNKDINFIYKVFHNVYPNIEIYDYNVILRKKEIEYIIFLLTDNSIKY